MSAILRWSKGFLEKLLDREYRHAYAADQVRTRVAFQIRSLREQRERGWSQSEMGRRMGKPQSVISRLEDPDYGRLSLQSLFEVADVFDLALIVEWVEWDEWLERMSDFSAVALHKKSFDGNRLMESGDSGKYQAELATPLAAIESWSQWRQPFAGFAKTEQRTIGYPASATEAYGQDALSQQVVLAGVAEPVVRRGTVAAISELQ